MEPYNACFSCNSFLKSVSGPVWLCTILLQHAVDGCKTQDISDSIKHFCKLHLVDVREHRGA